MPATLQQGQNLPALFREIYPRHAAKSLARLANAPYETARNWVRGRAAPSFETLARMARQNDALREHLIKAMAPDAEAMAPARCAAAGEVRAVADGVVEAGSRLGEGPEVMW